ncbi:MAG: hypothetical protein HC828_04340 [Blastochloris sp.]|nr:hypothetical protein [Blastochloris sp.]
MSTAAIGKFTTPVEATGTLFREQRKKLLLVLPSSWKPEKLPETGPLDEMLHRRPPSGSAIMSEGPWWNRTETRWRFSRDLHIVHGMRGLGAGLTFGMLADAFLQWLSDLGACLSPKEVALRMLISGGFGLVSGLIGVGVFTGVAFVGGTTLTATLAGIAASAVASNWGLVSPLPGWKKQSLNWVVR